MLALGLLGLGLLYLGDYRASLIGAQFDSPGTQGEISAAASSEGAVCQGPNEPAVIVPELGRQMLRRLVEPTHARARFFFQAEDGIRDADVTGVQTCALPI